MSTGPCFMPHSLLGMFFLWKLAAALAQFTWVQLSCAHNRMQELSLLSPCSASVIYHAKGWKCKRCPQRTNGMCVWMHVCMYVCVYICIYVEGSVQVYISTEWKTPFTSSHYRTIALRLEPMNGLWLSSEIVRWVVFQMGSSISAIGRAMEQFQFGIELPTSVSFLFPHS